MTDVESLLPADSEIGERVLEQVMARAARVPVEIEKLLDALQAPEDFLPFLAWQSSVDVWPEHWDDAKKREAIRQSIRLHKILGTPKAIREYIRMAGAEVVRFARPPSNAFLSRSFSAEERDQWLAHYPELRIYPFRGRTFRPRSFFLGRGHLGVATGPKGATLFPTEAADRAGRRATLFDRGTEIELSVTAVAAVEKNALAVVEEAVHLPTLKPFSTFLGAKPRVRRFLGGKGSGVMNTVRLTHSVRYAALSGERTRKVVAPGLTPIDPTPVERFEKSVHPAWKAFAGRCFLGRHFLVPSTAFLRVYDVVWLYRPGIHVQPRQGRCFLNATRLGQAPYTADIKVRLKKPATPRKQFIGPGQFLAGALIPHDPTLLVDTLRAVEGSKSLRDQINLDINCTDFLRAGDMVCGEAVCGQQVETP